jgi:CRAL/TRIO domain
MAAYEKSAVQTNSKAKTDGKAPPKLLRLFALYENLTRFVMPLCTALTDREHPETPITQSNNIVDISGVGLKQFWNLRTHMQDASTLATAHYPETLDRIFVRTILLAWIISCSYPNVIDHWCPGLFPNRLGMDQAMV